MTIWYDVDTALAEVPVNVAPLTDDGDFKTIETGVAYNAGGMALNWHFVTAAGAYTVTAVTPTSGGTYDWAHQAQGMYTIEIPASGGASINNDTEGFGWFTGFATGVLPWRGPTLGFRAAGLNNLLVEDAFSATRGLAGTALPAAAADAAGGLPISDAGGLDLDALNSNVTAALADTNELQQDWTNGGRLDNILDARASQTSVDDLPTNAELAAALAAADDAVLAAIAALENLSQAEAQAAAEAALAAYGASTFDPASDEVETGVTYQKSLRLSNAALGGKSSGLDTTNAKYRDLADSKDRVDATVDADGNRTAVTLDLT